MEPTKTFAIAQETLLEEVRAQVVVTPTCPTYFSDILRLEMEKQVATFTSDLLQAARRHDGENNDLKKERKTT